MSRQGLLCGALTGGVLACGPIAGIRRGSTREDRVGLRDETYPMVQELTRRFEARFGAVDCGTMTGCDFLTDKGQERFERNEVKARVCRPAVRFAVESVIDVLA